MWTPRRLLVLFVAVGLFAGVFYLYANTAVGKVDGLPQLPAEFLIPSTDSAPPPEPLSASPTTQQLVRAFGPTSPEVTDPLAYKFKFEDRERGLVFAAGQPEFGREASRFVRVSPCSVGFFADAGKRVKHVPGEVEEFSTFHADECILQFDREVTGPQDISKAKLVGMELKSQPDLPTADPRRGRIWVTNNQKSPDPNDRLLFRTPGPLFYQAPDADRAKKPTTDAPQVWTSAGVEVIDCRNLPRPLPAGTEVLPTLPGDQLRARGVVADMVGGVSLPPPTMSALGMKIYLKPQAESNSKDKRNTTGYGGVRLIELGERVQINLWTDGGTGMPGTGAPAPPGAKPDPTLAAPLAGGLAEGAVLARRLADKSLLVIETTGSFRYDFEKAQARFDIAQSADPNRPNNVTVARIGSTGRLDDLFCTQLVVDFFGGPDKPQGEGLSIKELTATGPHVYLSVEAEAFSAQGVYLNYRTDPKARTTYTTLRGSPVVAKKERNALEGGNKQLSAEIVLTSIDPPPPTPGQKAGEKSSLVEVRGPGRMSLFDAASNDTSLSASWNKSLIQQKDTVGNQVQDLLRFEGGGEFRDIKADFRLTADQLWLWVAPDPRRDTKKDGGNNALPQRLLARQNVVSRSPELEIGMAGQPAVDQLLVWFRDGEPPAPVAQPVAPLIPAPTGQANKTNAVPGSATSPARSPTASSNTGETPSPTRQDKSPAIAKQSEPKKQPVQLSARVVESWVLRYPLPADPKKPNEPSLKYEMERARCDDRVVVHQEPADPTKTPRGLDVTGQTLNLNQGRAGSVMVVTGTPLNRAEVHFETTTIIGPTVKIDQPNNAVEVTGGGLLRMPSQSDFGSNGPAPEQPNELEITWSKEMRFEGTNALAEFIGSVKAVQTPDRGHFRPKAAVTPRPVGFRPGEQPVQAQSLASDPTWSRTAVFCHRLDVGFDRPIYFNQMRRGDEPKKEGDGAKLRRAVCTPKPDDEVATSGPSDRTVVYLEETLDRRTRKLTRAQRIECNELELLNDEVKREQIVHASGEGEVRILQPGAKDGPGLGQPAPKRTQSSGAEEMKLTLVKFATRMDGLDQAKLFQSASFANGARVWQTPTDDLNLQFDLHNLPPGTVRISCEEKLEVTSQKLRPDDPPDQRLTATGAAEAESDEYRGNGPVIRYLRDTVVFEGTDRQPAGFEQRRVGVNNKNQTHGRVITYFTQTGQVKVDGGTTGSFTPSNR